jgi:hypothetical protein
VLSFRVSTGREGENRLVCGPASLQVGRWMSEAYLDYATARRAMARFSILLSNIEWLESRRSPFGLCPATTVAIGGSLLQLKI